MNMNKHSIIVLSLLGLVTVSGCGEKKIATTYTRQFGESCSETDGCLPGLTCENGICRIVCENDSDCQTGYSCFEQRCVIDTSQGTTPGETTTAKMGEACSEEKKCETGLLCEQARCVMTCEKDTNCPDNYYCGDEMRCLSGTRPDVPPPEPQIGSGMLPEGGALGAISGSTSSDEFTIKVLGGSLRGIASDGDFSATISEGKWN